MCERVRVNQRIRGDALTLNRPNLRERCTDQFNLLPGYHLNFDHCPKLLRVFRTGLNIHSVPFGITVRKRIDSIPWILLL